MYNYYYVSNFPQKKSNYINKMGNLLSYFIKKRRILILGPYNSGKTTVLKHLSVLHKYKPKMIKNKHFNFITISNYNIWELEEGIDPMITWSFYYDNVSCVIYVYDATNPIKSENLLHSLIYTKELRKKPLLIVINKIEKDHVVPEEIVNFAKRKQIYYTEMTRNDDSTNLKDGFDWLLRNI